MNELTLYGNCAKVDLNKAGEEIITNTTDKNVTGFNITFELWDYRA